MISEILNENWKGALGKREEDFYMKKNWKIGGIKAFVGAKFSPSNKHRQAE